MLQWMALTFARFAGLVMVIMGTWAFVGNVLLPFTGDLGASGWVLAWVLVAGLAGASGGVLYLLSLDGPQRLRNRRSRTWGWVGMLLGSLMPSFIAPLLVVMVLLALPTLFMFRQPREEPATSE